MPDREKVIEGLEWILEGDRFGFGVNWYGDCVPQCEEEQAGLNITRAIELLKEQQHQVWELQEINSLKWQINLNQKRKNY